MIKEELNGICPANIQEWREWLQENHLTEDSVWLIVYKKGSTTPTITWSEAVDQALCFGWIDSLKKSIDADRYKQYYSKRKPRSIWSKINKLKVEKLIAAGLMVEAGFKSIEVAKANGSWTILDEVEELNVPEDLKREFDKRPGGEEFFLGLTKSFKRGLLHWMVMARRPETRLKRVIEIAENAGNGLMPKHFR